MHTLKIKCKMYPRFMRSGNRLDDRKESGNESKWIDVRSLTAWEDSSPLFVLVHWVMQMVRHLVRDFFLIVADVM